MVADMNFPRKVYLLYNTVTGKGYVGSTVNIKQRMYAHFITLKCGKHPVEELQNDYDEYGDHFTVKILDTIYSIDETHKEHDWMRKLNTFDKRYGYNYKDHVRAVGKPLKLAKYFYEYKGQLLSAGELSLLTDIPYACLQSRLRSGWSAERAITEPKKQYDLLFNHKG
jgi:hypothetical protein